MVDESRRVTYSIQSLDHLVYELLDKNDTFDAAFERSISVRKITDEWNCSTKVKRDMVLILLLAYTGNFQAVPLSDEDIKDLIMTACYVLLTYSASLSPSATLVVERINTLGSSPPAVGPINDLKLIAYVVKFFTECVEHIAVFKQIRPVILRLFTYPSWFFNGGDFACRTASKDPITLGAVEKIVSVYNTVDQKIAKYETSASRAEELPKSVIFWHYARLFVRHGLCEILLNVDQYPEDGLLQQRLTVAERILELFASCLRQPTIRNALVPLMSFIQLGAALEFSTRLSQYSRFFVKRLRDLLSLTDDEENNHFTRTKADSIAKIDMISDLQRMAYAIIQAHFNDEDSLTRAVDRDILPELKFWKRIRSTSTFVLCDKIKFEELLSSATLENLMYIADRTLDPESIKYIREYHANLKTTSSTENNRSEKYSKTEERVLIEVLLHHFFIDVDWSSRISGSAIVANECLLWGDLLEEEPNIMEEEIPLALPVLGNQYHSLSDLFIDHFELYRLEAFFDIRKDLELALWQIKPQRSRTSEVAKLLFGEVHDIVAEKLDKSVDYTDPQRSQQWHGSASDPICRFEGKSANAALIKSTTITNAVDANDVLGEVQLDLRSITRDPSQWDRCVQTDQILYLCCLGGIDRQYEVGESAAVCKVTEMFPHAFKHPSEFAQAYNILSVRACVIAGPSHSTQNTEESNSSKQQNYLRSYSVKFDSTQYRDDMIRVAAGTLPDNLYSLFNVCVRRKPEANTLTSHLSTLKNLLLQRRLLDDFVSPEFRSVFLGRVDQRAASQVELTEELERHLSESRPGFDYTHSQKIAIAAALESGITLIAGPPGTGKTDVAVQIVSLLQAAPDNHKTLLLARSNYALNEFFTKIAMFGVDPSRLLRLGMGEANLQIRSGEGDEREEFSAEGRVAMIERRHQEALSEIRDIAAAFGIPNELAEDCCTSLKMREFYLKPHLDFYEIFCSSMPDVKGLTCSEIKKLPLWLERVASSAFYRPLYERTLKIWEESHGENSKIDCDIWELLWPHELKLAEGEFDGHTRFHKEKKYILSLFQYIEDYYPFELFRSTHEKTQYMSTVHAQVVAMTSARSMASQSRLVESGFEFSTVIIEEAAQLLEIESILSAFLQKNSKTVLKRIILLGDPMQLGPVVQHRQLRDRCKLGRSLFRRLMDLDHSRVYWLDLQGRMRKELADIWRGHYKVRPVGDMEHVAGFEGGGNRGLAHTVQCIDSSPSGEESETAPHHFVNYAEIEWCLALYIYMRSQNCQAQRITLLTPYSAQRDLCKRRFGQVAAQYGWLGMPSRIATVDEYQGQQNDYIILTLVRSRRPGHIADEGRAIVALSRARLGLYIICNRPLYQQSKLNREFLSQLWRSPQAGLILADGHEIVNPQELFTLVKEIRAKNITDDSEGAFDPVPENDANRHRVDKDDEEI